MTHDENQKEELDPEGLPLDRQMDNASYNEKATAQAVRQHAVVTHDLEPTSPAPLSGKPASYLVGQTAPGHSEAPMSAVEAPKAVRGNEIPEYRAPESKLRDVITARDIYSDRSNPDGCQEIERQR